MEKQHNMIKTITDLPEPIISMISYMSGSALAIVNRLCYDSIRKYPIFCDHVRLYARDGNEVKALVDMLNNRNLIEKPITICAKNIRYRDDTESISNCEVLARAITATLKIKKTNHVLKQVLWSMEVVDSEICGDYKDIIPINGYSIVRNNEESMRSYHIINDMYRSDGMKQIYEELTGAIIKTNHEMYGIDHFTNIIQPTSYSFTKHDNLWLICTRLNRAPVVSRQLKPRGCDMLVKNCLELSKNGTRMSECDDKLRSKIYNYGVWSINWETINHNGPGIIMQLSDNMKIMTGRITIRIKRKRKNNVDIFTDKSTKRIKKNE